MDQNDSVNQGVKSETRNAQASGEVGTKSVPPAPQPQVINEDVTKQVNDSAADISGSATKNENASQAKPPERKDDQAFQAELVEKEKRGQKIVLYIAIVLFSISILGLIVYFLLAR